MPAHVAAVLSIALLSVQARASVPWDDGVRAELDEVEDRGAADAELTPEALLIQADRDRVLLEDERDALE